MSANVRWRCCCGAEIEFKSEGGTMDSTPFVDLFQTEH